MPLWLKVHANHADPRTKKTLVYFSGEHGPLRLMGNAMTKIQKGRESGAIRVHVVVHRALIFGCPSVGVGNTFSEKSVFFGRSHLSRAAALPGAELCLGNA